MMDNCIIRKPSAPLPDPAAWAAFRGAMKRLQKTGYGDFRFTDDLVIVHSPFSESLLFSRDMDSSFCKLDYRDGYFLRTIAAAYLLYDRHCGRGHPGVSYGYAGTWENVQEGVDDLKEAGVFDPDYAYVLPYTEAIRDQLKLMHGAAKEAVEDILDEALALSPKQAATAIREAAVEAILPLVPLGVREFDAVALLCDRDLLGKLRFARIDAGGDVRWFRSPHAVAEAFPGDPPPFLNLSAFGPSVSPFNGEHQGQEYDVRLIRYRDLRKLEEQPRQAVGMRL